MFVVVVAVLAVFAFAVVEVLLVVGMVVLVPSGFAITFPTEGERTVVVNGGMVPVVNVVVETFT